MHCVHVHVCMIAHWCVGYTCMLCVCECAARQVYYCTTTLLCSHNYYSETISMTTLFKHIMFMKVHMNNHSLLVCTKRSYIVLNGCTQAQYICSIHMYIKHTTDTHVCICGAWCLCRCVYIIICTTLYEGIYAQSPMHKEGLGIKCEAYSESYWAHSVYNNRSMSLHYCSIHAFDHQRMLL